MSFEDIEDEIQDSVNKISLAAAVIVLSSWLLIGILRSNLFNRITLYFQISIAFIDILRHLSTYFLEVENETLCGIVGALANSSDHIYVAFNVLIALNAHLIFVSRQRPKMSFYPLYAVITLMYIGIINFSYYMNGIYGRNLYGQCFFKAKDNLAMIKFYIIYVMEIPGIIYCGLVVFLVIFCFNDRILKLRFTNNETYTCVDDNSSEPVDNVKKLYWRVSLYPISCFITMFPYFIGMFIYDLEMEPPNWYSFFYRLCNRLPGTTNFFFMLYDPNFQLAFKEFFNYVRSKFTKKLEDDKTYKLGEHGQSNQINKQPEQDQLCRDEDWKIEFDDGYKMSVQDHIRYL